MVGERERQRGRAHVDEPERRIRALGVLRELARKGLEDDLRRDDLAATQHVGDEEVARHVRMLDGVENGDIDPPDEVGERRRAVQVEPHEQARDEQPDGVGEAGKAPADEGRRDDEVGSPRRPAELDAEEREAEHVQRDARRPGEPPCRTSRRVVDVKPVEERVGPVLAGADVEPELRPGAAQALAPPWEVAGNLAGLMPPLLVGDVLGERRRLSARTLLARDEGAIAGHEVTDDDAEAPPVGGDVRDGQQKLVTPVGEGHELRADRQVAGQVDRHGRLSREPGAGSTGFAPSRPASARAASRSTRSRISTAQTTKAAARPIQPAVPFFTTPTVRSNGPATKAALRPSPKTASALVRCRSPASEYEICHDAALCPISPRVRSTIPATRRTTATAADTVSVTPMATLAAASAPPARSSVRAAVRSVSASLLPATWSTTTSAVFSV